MRFSARWFARNRQVHPIQDKSAKERFSGVPESQLSWKRVRNHAPQGNITVPKQIEDFSRHSDHTGNRRRHTSSPHRSPNRRPIATASILEILGYRLVVISDPVSRVIIAVGVERDGRFELY
jgi:hypothetical protein